MSKHFSFDVDVAMQYGVDEAILIRSFEYWIGLNKSNNKNQHDGRYWTYNSMRGLANFFPFWTDKQVARVVKSLINQEAIICGNYNQHKYDRTIWYAFENEDKMLEGVSPVISPSGKMLNTKRENAKPQTGEPIPITNPITNHLKDKRGKPAFRKPDLDEVNTKIIEMGYQCKGEDFFNYYASNGWMVGRNKMKSWQHSLAMWNSRQGKYDESKSTGKQELNWNIEW